jgi:hypothetical protein
MLCIFGSLMENRATPGYGDIRSQTEAGFEYALADRSGVRPHVISLHRPEGERIASAVESWPARVAYPRLLCKWNKRTAPLPHGGLSAYEGLEAVATLAMLCRSLLADPVGLIRAAIMAIAADGQARAWRMLECGEPGA